MRNKPDFSKTAISSYSFTTCTDQGDGYTTSCLLDYPYFKEYFKLIAIDLSKQKALDANPKTIQQINFTRNLDQTGRKIMKRISSSFITFATKVPRKLKKIIMKK